MHLRVMNPYVISALDDRLARRKMSIARQFCGTPTFSPEKASGTSSFGMAGTNAHLVLATPHLQNYFDVAGDMKHTR